MPESGQADGRNDPRGVRWGRVVGVIFTLLLLGAVLGHWLWERRASQRLARAVAALQAAGEPVSIEDLMGEGVPDDRNAALLLRRAAAGIDSDTDAWKTFNKLRLEVGESQLPLRDDERDMFRAMVDENPEAFALVEQAMQLDTFDWQIDLSVGKLNFDLSHLNGQRTLCNLLRAAALIAHDRGDDAAAVEHARKIFFVSRAVGDQPLLISMLTATGLRAMAINVISDIAPELRIGDSPGAVTPDKLRALIDELLDDAAPRELLVRGLRGERVFQQEMMREVMAGTAVPAPTGAPPPVVSGVLGYVIAPLFPQNALIMLQQMTRMIEAADAPDWPTYRAAASVPPELRKSWMHFLASTMLGVMDRAAFPRYRSVADAHLAAAALAIRWYALDHDGRLPATLDELVPAYLPHVPLDPMAGEGRRIGYVPDADRPRVYSVGANERDDGGREPEPHATARQNHDTSDTVVQVRRHPRPAPRPPDDN